MRKKITISSLLAKKNTIKVPCLTAYDYTSAQILDRAGIDVILVGDSLGMVMQGNENTLSVTVDEMIYHSKMVKKGIQYAFMIVDMPFGSYNTVEEGVSNAVKIIKETNADAVKFEGASEHILEIIKRLLLVGVNSVGHIGLQPQMVVVEGGYKIQGRTNKQYLVEQAQSLVNAGTRMIVLEGMDASCAKEITELVPVLTIGIGAGMDCDGQILVFHDVFGMFSDISPKFVKKYLNAGKLIEEAAKAYIDDVVNKKFPASDNIY